jgi:hypothetical protein
MKRNKYNINEIEKKNKTKRTVIKIQYGRRRRFVDGWEPTH